VNWYHSILGAFVGDRIEDAKVRLHEGTRIQYSNCDSLIGNGIEDVWLCSREDGNTYR
jgi:hypothetical protein